jgi:hypothetical protein
MGAELAALGPSMSGSLQRGLRLSESLAGKRCICLVMGVQGFDRTSLFMLRRSDDSHFDRTRPRPDSRSPRRALVLRGA